MSDSAPTTRHRLATSFCSAVDRDVRIAYVPGLAPDPHIPLPEMELICLEIGDTCTGRLCPLDAKPS